MKASCALLASIVLAGCSQPATQGTAGQTADREAAAFQPLKAKYAPVITGIDVKGTTLDLFVDADQLISMDEPVEDKMKAEALSRWRTIWKADNPGKHATLRVRLRNYYGETQFSESAKV
jgi:hypothetical protein